VYEIVYLQCGYGKRYYNGYQDYVQTMPSGFGIVEKNTPAIQQRSFGSMQDNADQ